MEKLVKIALRIITVLILLATVVSFSESYHGLFQWAITHDVQWFWALIWPLMLDTVILVGECSVFVAIHKHWKLRHRFWAWAVTYSGLAVSTLANGGHVASKDWLTHITNSLPPIALMFALTVGLGVLKRTRMMPAAASDPRPASMLQPVTLSVPPESPALSGSHTAAETPAESPLSAPVSPPETPAVSVPEMPAESADPRLSETMLSLGFKATEKSFTMPRDPRPELTLIEKRTRDMYDVDPDISVNAVKEALGIAWATAKKYLDATKEARGLPV